MATEITLPDLTDGTTTGSGVFDTLMAAQSAHLIKEYNAGRIKGQDYSNVYMSVMNATLQQAIQWQLQREVSFYQATNLEKQGNLTDEQIKLIVQQTLTEIERTRLTGNQADNAVKQGTLMDTQEATAEFDLANLRPAQRDLLTEQVKTQTAQTTSVTNQAALTDSQNDLAEYDLANVKPLQVEQLTEQIDLLQSQDLQAIEQTAYIVAQKEVLLERGGYR